MESTNNDSSAKGEERTEGQHSDASRKKKKKRPGLTPSKYFSERFPNIVQKYGPAFSEEKRSERTYLAEINEDCFAAMLGFEGCPAAPTIYLIHEKCFYKYSTNAGIYVPVTEEQLQTNVSLYMNNMAQTFKATTRFRELGFKFRKNSVLQGIVKKARGILAMPSKFFEIEDCDLIAVENGMLNVVTKELLEFDPKYRRRSKLPVKYDPAATCPLFLDTLMQQALPADDVELLQRWCGLALTGVNLSQVLMILVGTAGGGKGTFVRVILGIIGAGNHTGLRTRFLKDRFEIGRIAGKTLLYGADVSVDFLSQEGASALKSLVGGDSLQGELKGSNAIIEVLGRFNVLITSNSHLKIHIERDEEAWRRRLVIVEYRMPPPEEVIANLSDRIIEEEASGVLNWSLEGLDKIRADGWQLRKNEKQQALVDDLLKESNSPIEFINARITRDGSAEMTCSECYDAYIDFCASKKWYPFERRKFIPAMKEAIKVQFGISSRHDIPDEVGKQQEGWKGIKLANYLEKLCEGFSGLKVEDIDTEN